MATPLPLPQGFQTAGISCGIKESQTRDLSLFVSTTPASAAGVFTQNQVCGAPVQVCRARVPSAQIRGVVINSGNANACTGERGMEDAQWMTAEVARLLDSPPESVLVCSTGIIGHFLPRAALETGIPAAVGVLGRQPADFTAAAEAMMTTDTFAKQAVRDIDVGGKTIRVSGAGKGAAMIAPNMATMLAVIMTDCELSPQTADTLLRQSVDRSFNCISVDGHTSTSDTVLLLANGAAGEIGSEGLARLQQALDEVCMELAQAIIRDGEGAEHFVTIDVKGLRTEHEARQVAKAVAESALVKTAITGADPNWGRIVSAAGYAGVDFQEQDVTLRVNETTIYNRGVPATYDEAQLSSQMREQRDVAIELTFDLGNSDVRFWTTDLTAEYVRLNSEYTT